MTIQVLGSGCSNCKNLFEITKKAVSEMKLDGKVEYITGDAGMQTMLELGAMGSPVLVLDGKILMTGFTPDIEIIKKKLSAVTATH